MNGFEVFYSKSGVSVAIFAPTESDAKRLVIAALNDQECSGIGVRKA